MDRAKGKVGRREGGGDGWGGRCGGGKMETTVLAQNKKKERKEKNKPDFLFQNPLSNIPEEKFSS